MAIFADGTSLNRGKYKIVRILGAGGFGITYLATNQKTNETVVIKFLNVQELISKGKGATFGERQGQFINEAITLAKFDHPHIVKMYEMFREELNPTLQQATGEKWLHGMVMEYIDGQDIIGYLQTKGNFSEADGLHIIKQIGSALSLIHSKNHLHRDIKPQNIMLRKNGEAVLIDFGLARQLSFEESVSITGGSTPAFAPPEQLAQAIEKTRRGHFSPALDVFSLAATLYTMLAVKEPPFIPLENPIMTAYHMNMMKMSFPAPQELNPQLSQKVSDVILRGMALDISERPQSMQAWLDLFVSTPAKTPNYFQQGNDAYEAGKYEKAIASYDKALQIKPSYHEIWFLRGLALQDLGQYEEAIASYDKGFEIKPNEPHDHNVWFLRGLALGALGRNEEAIASYDKALQIKPDYHEIWFLRGLALQDLGQYEEAIASYDKILQIQPDQYEAWYNRGVALDELGRYEEAIASYDKALQIKPHDHEAWFNRGIALEKLGRYEEAIASYDKVLQNKPISREDLLKLPLAQRQEILAQQAQQMMPHYHDNPEILEWSGGDIVEYEDAVS